MRPHGTITIRDGATVVQTPRGWETRADGAVVGVSRAFVERLSTRERARLHGTDYDATHRATLMNPIRGVRAGQVASFTSDTREMESFEGKVVSVSGRVLEILASV